MDSYGQNEGTQKWRYLSNRMENSHQNADEAYHIILLVGHRAAIATPRMSEQQGRLIYRMHSFLYELFLQ